MATANISPNTTAEDGSISTISSVSSTTSDSKSDVNGDVGLGNDDLYWMSKVNSLDISNKGFRKRSQSASTDNTIRGPELDPICVADDPTPHGPLQLKPATSLPSSSIPSIRPPPTSPGADLRRVRSSDPQKPTSSFAKRAFGIFSRFKKDKNNNNNYPNNNNSPTTSSVNSHRVSKPSPSTPQPKSPARLPLTIPEEISSLSLNDDEKNTSIFSSRRKSKAPAVLDPNDPIYTPDTPHLVLNHTVDKPSCSVPEIDKVRVTRVNFALETFIKDPPQQIPARKPREGTVKVDEEKGVITRNHISYSNSVSIPENYKHSAETASQAAYKSAQQISQSISAERHEKKLHLPRLGRSSSNSKVPTISSNNAQAALGDLHEEENDEEDCKEGGIAASSSFLNGVDIDKGNAKKSDDTDADSEDGDAADSKKKSKKTSRDLTDVYTRCCHLREIMPIKAMLRQLEGYTGTLPFLRLLNPRPTMIEVLAFSDFISMVPINTIVLNRIDISDEMFRQIIISLSSPAATALSKLCLKNVNITPESWKIFCAFLVHNKSLAKLDISLTPQPSASTNFKYYDFEIFDRSKLDWDLFTKVLVARGGIEELILNRCLIPHEQFDRLIREGCCIATKRLGVASSDLQLEDFKSLIPWTTETSFVKEGIDLGGNDLSGKYYLIQELFAQSSLKCLSINSCNLTDYLEMQSVMQEKFVTSSEIRFLDLSFNPGLFPGFADFLGSSLPLFPTFRRLHLNHCGLTSQNIITLAEGFAKCKQLFHVGLAGNTDINPAAAEALAAAVKTSKSITCVELDEGAIPANILKRLNHYCMQNMESIVDNGVDEDDNLIDNGQGLVDAVKYVVDANQKFELADRCLLVADSLTQRAKTVRAKVQSRLESLISHHKSGSNTGKSPEENNRSFKENLIMLYYLETTLGRVLNSYDSITGSSASKRNPLRAVDRAETTAASADKDSENLTSIKKLSGDSEYMPEPPSDDSQYHVGGESEIRLLRSAGNTNDENTRKRQQAREEGDFHKLTTYIRRTRPNLVSADVGFSGEKLRQMLLREESDKAAAADSGKESNPSETHAPAAAANVPVKLKEIVLPEEEGDLQSLMDRLSNMSNEEIRDFIRKRYNIAKNDSEEA